MTRADVLALAGRHVKFTGTTTTAFSISLGQTQVMTLTVTPVVVGDSLAAQESITLQPGADLPAGINIAWAYPSTANVVRIGFTSSALISVAQTVAWTVVAHR
jgi:hypothetical protein